MELNTQEKSKQLDIQGKATLIMDAIKEDRNEIRTMTQQIYTVVSFIAVSSFAVTSFFIGLHGSQNFNIVTKLGRPFFVAIDASFLIILWGLFLRLVGDVNICQGFLEYRQDLLKTIAEGDSSSSFKVFDPLPSESTKPKISHKNLYWIAASTTVAILVKLIAVLLIY
jgi:hypothetical protein